MTDEKNNIEESAPSDAASKKGSKKSKSSGAHAKAAQSAYIQKSTRMRTVLIVVIVLLVALLIAIGVLAVQIFGAARDTAVQQTQVTEVATETEEEASDATPTVTKKTTVPNLVALLGGTQEGAMTALAHGAQVTRVLEVNEEGNPIKLDVQIALTEEPSDSRSGTPTVYLGMNDVGTVIRSGYSVATSSLGYGSLSFTDAVANEHIIEKTLEEAGLTVNVGAAQLPADKMQYSTYDTDGTTLIKEYYAFTGVGMAAGVEHAWESILVYDYTMANATGNLNDTIRTIYIYVS